MTIRKYLTIAFLPLFAALMFMALASCGQGIQPDGVLAVQNPPGAAGSIVEQQPRQEIQEETEYTAENLHEYQPESVAGVDASEEHINEYEEYYIEYVPHFPVADMQHGELAEYFLEYMNDNLPNRVSFSYREREAALWIAGQLELMGYTSEQIYIQKFSIAAAGLSSRARNPLRFFNTGSAELRDYSQNVILTIPGQTERKIIVGAHYDSFYYPGASDNASGTVLLMESAARMRHLDNYFTLVYIFFGAEEVGLIGAYYYLHSLSAEERENIVLMISADCLFDGDTMFYTVGYRAAGRLGTNAVSSQVDAIAERVIAQYDLNLIVSQRGLLVVSDHMPFYNAGHTVMIVFSSDVVDGRFRMRVFHSYRDDIHYINNRWPGRIQTYLHTFSVFLEEVLLMEGSMEG